MRDISLKENERIDDLQRNGYRIIQDPDRFCFGMDAVLLSGFAVVKDGARVLDLGTGTGIIPILLEAKTQAAHLTGLEIQADSAEMAGRSVALNGLEEKIDIITGDIKEADKLFDAASFDVITCNPPYMIGQHGLQNPSDAKAIARHEILCTLEDVISQTARLLVPGGRFFLVHRPFRLAEIIVMLTRYKLEPKRMRLVYPFVDKEPNMVLLEAVRGGRPRMTVEKPLIVYREPGVYMPEIYEVYGYNAKSTSNRRPAIGQKSAQLTWKYYILRKRMPERRHSLRGFERIKRCRECYICARRRLEIWGI